MSKVALLMPNEQLTSIAKDVVAKIDFPHEVIIRTVNRSNAVSILQSLQDIDLIISRGRIANILESAVDIPVIPIVSNAQEIGMLIMEAKKLTTKETPLIALIGYENAYCDTSHFHELFNVNIRTYHAVFDPESKDVEHIVTQAIADGIDVAICGSRSQKLWQNAGIPFVPFQTGSESLVEAFHIAKITLYAHELQKRNTVQLQTLIDSLTSAIIELDDKGLIVSYNHIADENFNLTQNYCLHDQLTNKLTFIDSEMLNRTYKDGEEIMGTGKSPQNISWIYNIVPIVDDKQISGAIVILQETNAVERMDRMFRKESIGSNYVGRMRTAGLKTYMNDCDYIQAKIQSSAASSVPVLLTAEQGLESEEIAYNIHESGSNASNPFVYVNCSELSESDQMRLLFGTNDFQGYCLNAHLGTLFLKHAECLSIEAQMRIIRIVEDNTIITGTDPHPVPLMVRVIAYIPDPRKALESHLITPEFLTSISILSICVPPLRERPNDLRQYITQFLKKSCRRYGRVAVLTNDATEELLRFPWPGNLRQLRGFCEKIVLSMRHRSISQGEIVNLLKELYVTEVPKQEISEHDDLSESELILSALRRHHWKRDEVAQELEISRSTLWRKMNQYGIQRK